MTFYQLMKKENGLTLALSNKENSENQQISKNKAALNLFNNIVEYFKTEEKKIKVSFIHFLLSYETFFN